MTNLTDRLIRSADASHGHSDIDVENFTYQVFAVDWHKVVYPLTFCFLCIVIAWIHLSQIQIKKYCQNFKYLKWVHGVPETCLLMIFGIILGVIIPQEALLAKDSIIKTFLDPHVFFIFILPPIVFEAGYDMPRAAFLSNLEEILTYAIFGTLLNTFFTGLSLWGLNFTGVFDDLPGDHEHVYTLSVFLLFGAIISAVDPVAVIAVFDEIHVNVTLYILVFGESLLNDGIAIVLYQVFEKFLILGNDRITLRECGLGIASFFVVAGGGTLIGIFIGFLMAFTSRFTHISHTLEPLIVLGYAYISYLLADMLEMSGILAIVFCGMTMRFYVEKNMDPSTLVALHHITKMLAVIAEMTIFVILGIVAATSDWAGHFYWKFSLIVLALITIFRPIIVIFLTWLLNFNRPLELTWKDMFIMAFSGLRGGIAFSLIVMSGIDLAINEDAKEAMTLTTIFVVFITVFVQGSLVGPLVNIFHIKTEDEHAHDHTKLSFMIHEKIIDHATDAITAICGHVGVSNFARVHKFEHFLQKCLDIFFLRESNQHRKDGNLQDVDDDRYLAAHELADLWHDELLEDIEYYTQTMGEQGQLHVRDSLRKKKNVDPARLIHLLEEMIDPHHDLKAVKKGQTGIQLKKEQRIQQHEIKKHVYDKHHRKHKHGHHLRRGFVFLVFLEWISIAKFRLQHNRTLLL